MLVKHKCTLGLCFTFILMCGIGFGGEVNTTRATQNMQLYLDRIHRSEKYREQYKEYSGRAYIAWVSLTRMIYTGEYVKRELPTQAAEYEKEAVRILERFNKTDDAGELLLESKALCSQFPTVYQMTPELNKMATEFSAPSAILLLMGECEGVPRQSNPGVVVRYPLESAIHNIRGTNEQDAAKNGLYDAFINLLVYFDDPKILHRLDQCFPVSE